MPPEPGSVTVRPILRVVEDAEPPFPYDWVALIKLEVGSRPLVKGLIDPGAFVVVYGPSGSGKSFFTADLAQCIATGIPWRGRKVNKGLVVYVASEAGASILKRFVAWRDNRLSEDVDDAIPLAILKRGPNLLASVEVEKLLETLRYLVKEAEQPLALVIFDTLSRSMHGGDENTAEDMTMAVNSADRIRDEFNAATVFVHHSGKDPAKGARGHSALFAAADVVLSVENRCATLEKVRDGVTGERFPFELEPVQIGTDADGDPVMTCLLNVSQDAPRTKALPRGKNQSVIYNPLKEFIAEAGEALPATSAIPGGVRAASIQIFIRRITPKFAGQPEWRVRQRVLEALMGLQANAHIGIHNDWVWLT